MKRRLIHTLYGMVMVVILGLFAGIATAVTAPPDGWLTCTGDIHCYTHAYWTGLGIPIVSEWECDYSLCSGDCATWRDSAIVEKTGTTIKVTLKNRYVPTNRKHVRFRIEGTGATGVPNALDIQGINNGLPNSKLYYHGEPTLTYASGSWVVDVVAEIIPQPDKVVLTVVIPGVPVVAKAWGDECCTEKPGPRRVEVTYPPLFAPVFGPCGSAQSLTIVNSTGRPIEVSFNGGAFNAVNAWDSISFACTSNPYDCYEARLVDKMGMYLSATGCAEPFTGEVPTLSEWGLIIFSLLILTLASVAVVRRKQSLAVAGDVTGSIKAPLFHAAVFGKTLAVTMALAVIGLGVAGAAYGDLALRDIIGTLISAGIVAYMAHLWIGAKRE